MNKIFSILAIAAMALTFSSCSNDDDNENTESSKYITISTSIGALTRTVTDGATGVQSFVKDDAISVYAWTGSATEVNTADLVVNNSINTYDGTKWIAATQMLWKDMTTAHYFLGVYPSRAITDFKADNYTLDMTKTQEHNDLLVAVSTGTDNAGFKATANAVPLQFDHVMAKLFVNLTFRNQWEDTPTVTSVTVNGMKSNAEVNYITKTATATGDATSVSLPVTTANKAYKSILVPQTGNNASISIKIGDKDYTYNGTVKLEGGKYTTVNLIVGRDGITLGSVSINDWGAGTTINGGEAQE